MKKKKILMLVCMAVLAVTVVIPVNAAKKTNKKQIQVLNLYQDQKTDIEEAEYLILIWKIKILMKNRWKNKKKRNGILI